MDIHVDYTLKVKNHEKCASKIDAGRSAVFLSVLMSTSLFQLVEDMRPCDLIYLPDPAHLPDLAKLGLNRRGAGGQEETLIKSRRQNSSMDIRSRTTSGTGLVCTAAARYKIR